MPEANVFFKSDSMHITCCEIIFNSLFPGFVRYIEKRTNRGLMFRRAKYMISKSQ